MRRRCIAVWLAAGLLVLVTMVTGPAHAQPQAAVPGWTVVQVSPPDRPELVLRATATTDAAAPLELTVRFGDPLEDRATPGRTRLVDAGDDPIVRLGPFDRPYGPAHVIARTNGTETMLPVFVGTLDVGLPQPWRVADYERHRTQQTPARAGEGAAPVAKPWPPAGTAPTPPLSDGRAAPDEAVVFVVYTQGQDLDAGLRVLWLDDRGSPIGAPTETNGTVTATGDPFGPALLVPPRAVRAAVEWSFDGGATRAGFVDIPAASSPPRALGPDPAPGSAWVLAAVALVAAAVGAALAVRASRPRPAPRVHQ